MYKKIFAVAVSLAGTPVAFGSSAEIKAIVTNDKVATIERDLVKRGYELDGVRLTAARSPHEGFAMYALRFARETTGGQKNTIEFSIYIEEDGAITVPNLIE